MFLSCYKKDAKLLPHLHSAICTLNLVPSKKIPTPSHSASEISFPSTMSTHRKAISHRWIEFFFFCSFLHSLLPDQYLWKLFHFPIYTYISSGNAWFSSEQIFTPSHLPSGHSSITIALPHNFLAHGSLLVLPHCSIPNIAYSLTHIHIFYYHSLFSDCCVCDVEFFAKRGIVR